MSEYSFNNNRGMTNDHTTVTRKKCDVSIFHKTQNLPIRFRHMLASQMSTDVDSSQTTFLQSIRRHAKRQR